MWQVYDINGRMRYIKYCLIIFTCLFVLSGISFIIIGSSVNAIYSEYSYFLHSKYFSPAILLTGVGFGVFFIACLGLVGTFRESSFLIIFFGVSLGVIFILQVAAGITNYFLMDTINEELETSLNNTMHRYYTRELSAGHMDVLQQDFHCCGIESPTDWSFIGNGSVPMSCCAEINSTNGHCIYAFSRGCLSTLINITQYSGKIFAVTTYILSAMHLAGMFFAFYLESLMRQQKVAREARRWLIRDTLLNENEKKIEII